MGRLDFRRISSYLVTFRSQRLFTAWLAWLMLGASVAADGQISCPQAVGPGIR
jgi:hypothetical protein